MVGVDGGHVPRWVPGNVAHADGGDTDTLIKYVAMVRNVRDATIAHVHAYAAGKVHEATGGTENETMSPELTLYYEMKSDMFGGAEGLAKGKKRAGATRAERKTAHGAQLVQREQKSAAPALPLPV